MIGAMADETRNILVVIVLIAIGALLFLAGR